MNTESCDCRRIRDLPLPREFKTQPGDFGWDTDMVIDGVASRSERGEGAKYGCRVIYLHLPGESRWTAIHVTLGQHTQVDGIQIWHWDGNEDKPTLEPSILNQGVWHGYLRAGRLESC